jgi:hypothetical protein
MTAYPTTAPDLTASEQLYLHDLRVLGAWWCLGSSALDPRVLLQHAPARVALRREAGL